MTTILARGGGSLEDLWAFNDERVVRAIVAHALPIVSTCPQVAVPQLRDGENIALAPAGDVQALARRVLALASSSVQRAQLSQGAERLAQEFIWPRIVDQHLELYARLLGR